jgi:hypothetical protein
MQDLQDELTRLVGLRRRMMLQLGVTAGLAPVVLHLLWGVELARKDARWLAAAAVGLLSWVVVRAVVDVASVLEERCPACREPFLGGLSRALLALPLPPTECVSCQIGLDGQRPHPARSKGRAG